MFFYYSLYFKGSQVIFFWKGGPRPQPLKIKGGAYNFEGGGGGGVACRSIAHRLHY